MAWNVNRNVIWIQWRRNRGFRRFNELGPPSSWGPRVVELQKFFLGKTLRKIIKIVATRWRILRLKCTKFNFGWGSDPDPAGGAYSAPPDPLAGFGAASRQGEGLGWGRGGKGEGGGWTRAPQSLATPVSGLPSEWPMCHLSIIFCENQWSFWVKQTKWKHNFIGGGILMY